MTGAEMIEIGWVVTALVVGLSIAGSIRNYGRGLTIKVQSRVTSSEGIVTTFNTTVSGLERDNAGLALARNALAKAGIRDDGSPNNPPTK